MKITETIERECCETKDFIRYEGILRTSSIDPIFFCRHCGELWIPERHVVVGDGSALKWERLFDGQHPDRIFEFLLKQGNGWVRTLA